MEEICFVVRSKSAGLNREKSNKVVEVLLLLGRARVELT